MHDLLDLLLPLALSLGHEIRTLDWAQRFWAAETLEQRDDVAAEWWAKSPAFEVVKHARGLGRLDVVARLPGREPRSHPARGGAP